MTYDPELAAGAASAFLGRRLTRDERDTLAAVVHDDQDLLLFLVQHTELLAANPGAAASLATLTGGDEESVAALFDRREDLRRGVVVTVTELLAEQLLPRDGWPSALQDEREVQRHARLLSRLRD